MVALVATLFVVPFGAAAADGDISTHAGGGSQSGDGVQATSAALDAPTAVAVDAAGDLLVAEQGSGKVRRVDSNGVISTVVSGIGAVSDIAPAPDGSIYAATEREIIRIANGTFTIVASFSFKHPASVAVDPTYGDVYYTFAATDGDDGVWRVDSPSHVRIAGNQSCDPANPNANWNGDGLEAHVTNFCRPGTIRFDGDGNLLIVDTYHYRLRKRATGTGYVSTIAGTGVSGFSGDSGPATSARVGLLAGVAVDGNGNVYVADGGRIRVISLGSIYTVAGTGATGFSGDGGPAVQATFDSVNGLAMRASALFVADSGNDRVRRIDYPTWNAPVSVEFDDRYLKPPWPWAEIGTEVQVGWIFVTNTGGAAAQVSISLAGTNQGDFRVTGCPSVLAAGSGCGVIVTFIPTNGGVRSADVEIRVPGYPVYRRTAQGVGVTTMSHSPASIAFGQGEMGVPITRPVTLTNTGAGDLFVTDSTFTGHSASDFRIASDTCTNVAVSPGGTCTIHVEFTPGPANRSAALRISANIWVGYAADTYVSVPLSGYGVDTRPPVTVLESATDVAVVRAGSTIAGRSTDIGTGVARVQVRYDPLIGAAQSATTGQACPTGECRWTVRAPTLPGTYVMTAYAVDRAANTESPGDSIRLVVA